MTNLVPEPIAPPTSAAVVVTSDGSSLSASHVAGGGAGAVVGAGIVAVVQRFAHVHVSDVDAAIVGSAAVSVGVGVGHVVGRVGFVGLFKTLLYGNRK